MSVAQTSAKRAKFDQVMGLIRAGDLNGAHETLENARRFDPQEINFLNLAAWLAGLRGDNDRSIALYRQIVKRMPDNQEASFNLRRAEAIKAEKNGDLRAALKAFQEASALVPENHILQSQIALLQRQMCLFQEIKVPPGLLPSPAEAMVFEPDPAAQQKIAENWAHTQFDNITPLPSRATRNETAVIKLGFISSDFHEHATAYLIADMLGFLDRGDFSVHAYSYGTDDGSAMRQRLREACDHFTDIRKLNPREAALQIRNDAIDILVDLKGCTRGGRLDILAHKPAPVQMHWLGFPGTTGCRFIQYFIADPIVLPPASARYFTEKVIWLPHCYQANDRARPLPPPLPRRNYGLPEEATVFASFNQTYKLTPELIALWSQILSETPSSVLWLLASNKVAPDNIRSRFQSHDIDPARLFFANPVSLEQHLQRYHAVDVALDTFPVGGHTTSSDALWLGAPVVTCPGESFVGRVTASLLSAVGLHELIAEDTAHYCALAIDLGRNQSRREKIRRHLTENRLQLPLFDSGAFAKDFATGLKLAMGRHRQGVPSDHIIVKQDSSEEYLK